MRSCQDRYGQLGQGRGWLQQAVTVLSHLWGGNFHICMQMRRRPERYSLLGPGGSALQPQELEARLRDKLILENIGVLSQHGLVSDGVTAQSV